MGMERHLCLYPGLRQEGHSGSPHQAGANRNRFCISQGCEVWKKHFPEGWCKRVENAPSGVWTEYTWPKPGATEGSRKLTYCLHAKGSPYLACAGAYDDKPTIGEAQKM